ncbi:hypothetical protein V3C99_018748 [Haemonchus contortus]|uniref:Mitochondrial import receptor subunit TOM70 n=1 Tax=Haemonchus contortus TaxID=6289 RepID=A0A7I4Z0I7_HAECO|nr:mitochondrial import receptor subunit [Haemonchus contortus]
MPEHQNLYRYVAIATAVGVSAAGLYYLIWRRSNSKKKSLSVKELKDLGNKLFAAKKYADSIRIFSKAIAAGSSDDCELLKAMCYQNRAAAKEHHGGYNVDDMLSDCEQALNCNPRYAKAYFRRARLLEMKKEHMPSLISLFCATQLDPALDTQSSQLLPVLLEELEKKAHQEWLDDTSSRGKVKHVRHEKVYSWLYKTVMDDCVRRDVLTLKISDDSPYTKAIELIRNKKYDDVADLAVQQNGSHEMEAQILAARFYFYRNQMDRYSTCIDKFDALFGALPEEERKEKEDLLIAKHILLIESGRTPQEIKKAFTTASDAIQKKCPDFYVMASFRYVLCNEITDAMELLTTEGMSTTNMKLLLLTLQILRNANREDNTPDMAMLHGNILQLESFVNSLDPKSGYALSILAKITATFSSDAAARSISDEILKMEPTESIHYFDRSCMSASGKDAMEYLEKCMAIEPYHPEANLMFASLMMNEIGSRAVTPDEYERIDKHIAISLSTFDDNIDFPVILAVFRLREVLAAKKEAARILSLS